VCIIRRSKGLVVEEVVLLTHPHISVGGFVGEERVEEMGKSRP